MKQFLFFFILLGSFAFSQTNNINVTIDDYTKYRIDSLTTAIDTADINFTRYEQYSSHNLYLSTISGADTVTVYLQSLDTLTYVQTAVINKASTSTVTALATIPVSTTPVEYFIVGSWKQKVRLISSSNDGSVTRFILGIK